MTHAQVCRRLSAYLEGELSAADEDRLEAHLTECVACAAELRALRRAIELLHGLPSPQPAGDLAMAVMARLREAEERPPFFRALLARHVSAWLAPAAAACALGAIGWIALSGPSFPPIVSVVPRAPESSPADAPLQVAALPSMESCVQQPRTGDPTRDDCVHWYAWFVGMALEDSRRFAHEMNRIPAPARHAWIGRVSEYAQRSGSGLWIGSELRRTHEPEALSLARSFERGSTPIESVSFRAR
jgi:hypothetical protein